MRVLYQRSSDVVRGLEHAHHILYLVLSAQNYFFSLFSSNSDNLSFLSSSGISLVLIRMIFAVGVSRLANCIAQIR